MRIKLQAGEVWLADLGLAAKVRPVLLIYTPRGSDARTLVMGKQRWLPKESAVNVQGLASFDPSKLIRRLGVLTAQQMTAVKDALRELLEL